MSPYTMMMANSDPILIPSTIKIQVVIGMLTIMIKIGKYLPYIVFTSATACLASSILDIAIWGNLPLGVLNATLAIGGFVLSGQLLQRHDIGRREHFTEGRHRTVNKRTIEDQPRVIAFD